MSSTKDKLLSRQYRVKGLDTIISYKVPLGEDSQGGKFSCWVCPSVDTNGMVSCDECARWFHFECVGVDESIAENVFVCPKCDYEDAFRADALKQLEFYKGIVENPDQI